MKKEPMDLSGVFIAYLRVGDRPIGCLMAKHDPRSPEQYETGWSLCSGRDQFSYRMARRIAYGRMMSSRKINTQELPQPIADFFVEMTPLIGAWMKKEPAAPEEGTKV